MIKKIKKRKKPYFKKGFDIRNFSVDFLAAKKLRKKKKKNKNYKYKSETSFNFIHEVFPQSQLIMEAIY